MLILAGLVACSKEDLDQPVLYENLYTIQDDPSDPVKHRIYTIYEKYGLPVYFNDTVGKYYVRDDVNGNPYYRYELIDLNWNFYTDNSQGITYNCFYQTDPERQMISLDFVEKFLGNLSRPLQPAVIFVADSISYTDKEKKGYLKYALRFRSVTFTGIHTKTMVQKDSLFNDVTRALIKSKISRYTYALTKFNAVCKNAWYDSKWSDDLGLEMKSSWGPTIFEEWAKEYLMEGTPYDPGWTEEEVEAERNRIRLLIGSFGFVGGGKNAPSVYSPENTSRDLDTYMIEVLSCDRAEFTRRWSQCPLVMKKYEILYNLLKDELDYEL